MNTRKKKKVEEKRPRPTPATELGLQTPEIEKAQRETPEIEKAQRETIEIEKAQRETIEETSFEDVTKSGLGSGISGMAMTVSFRRFKEDFPKEVKLLDSEKEIFYREAKNENTAYVVYIFTETNQYKYYAKQLEKRSNYDYRFKVSLINVLERKKTLKPSNESSSLGDLFEYSFSKWNSFEKKVRKKSIFRAHKGTNWKQLKAKSGYKRVKMPGTKRYVLVRQSPHEKVVRSQIGKQLGRSSHMFK